MIRITPGGDQTRQMCLLLFGLTRALHTLLETIRTQKIAMKIVYNVDVTHLHYCVSIIVTGDKIKLIFKCQRR